MVIVRVVEEVYGGLNDKARIFERHDGRTQADSMQRGIIASGTTLVIGQTQHTAGLQCPEYAAEKHLRFLANAQLLLISYMTVLIYLQAKRRSI